MSTGGIRQAETWDPFRDLMTLQRDVNRLFSSVGLPASFVGSKAAGWVPSVDVMAKGEDLVLRVELPGVEPSDVDVSITEGVMTVSGERRESKEQQQGDYLMKESSYGAFQRTMRLPEGVDPTAVRAEFRNGVLQVTVPKAAAKRAPMTRRVPVQGAQPRQMQQPGQQQTAEQRPSAAQQTPQAGPQQQAQPQPYTQPQTYQQPQAQQRPATQGYQQQGYGPTQQAQQQPERRPVTQQTQTYGMSATPQPYVGQSAQAPTYAPQGYGTQGSQASADREGRQAQQAQSQAQQSEWTAEHRGAVSSQTLGGGSYEQVDASGEQYMRAERQRTEPSAQAEGQQPDQHDRETYNMAPDRGLGETPDQRGGEQMERQREHHRRRGLFHRGS